MTDKVRHQAMRIKPAYHGVLDRRKFVLACWAAPFAICLPMRGFAAPKTRSPPSASDQAKLQHLLSPDETTILSHASLAPSGHNTQPWTVQVIAPGHWVIGTDKQRWLPAVDPTNRETTLSIGAFLENLVTAAERLGYAIEYQVVANATTDPRLVDLKLRKAAVVEYPIERLEKRRTVRSDYINDLIKNEDIRAVTDGSRMFAYFARDTKPARYLAEATIEANRKQAYRDPAQEELANWIRWSKKDQERLRNGLTPAGMEVTGIAGWYVRSFYNRDSVLKKGFRETGIKQVVERVAQGGGWLVISGETSVASLIETGRKFQRMWLKLRERGIAIHPMTQILEETTNTDSIAKELGIGNTPQFVLRIGYVKIYPDPVSPRMPVAWFTHAA
jgi:hypothetical protein